MFNFKKLFIKTTAVLTATMTVLAFCGCDKGGNTSGDNDEPSSTASQSSDVTGVVTSDTDTSEIFSNRDSKTEYETDGTPTIAFSGTSVNVSGSGVTGSNGVATISAEGTYIVSGTASSGQIVIDAADSEKITLVLSGADITCSQSAAIYVKQADKVFITLAEGTENKLTETGTFSADGETNVDGVIFSKQELTINGDGSLTISTESGHGIVCKDDLVLYGGTYNIDVSGHAITANDSVSVAEGTFTLNSDKDGLHAENTEDTTKGFVYIKDGTFNITAGGDGVDCSGCFQIDGGTLNITSGGGAGKSSSQSSGSGMGDRWSWNSTTDSSSSGDSTKGIKSSGNILINGGTVNVNSADDAIHSNADSAISGGTIELAAGDDGIHADGSNIIDNGTINITTSYEGIEGETITINGGEITLVASDDGLNAASGSSSEGGFGGMGGGVMDSNSANTVTINGGTLYVNASGDGLDSNGDFIVTGGNIYVSGPTNSGNGALDFGGTGTITGGTLIACGSSGMAQNFGSDSTQGTALVTTNSSISGGTEVIIKDSDGNVIIDFTPEKQFNCVVFSSPKLTKGSTCTMTAGSWSQSITFDSLVYGGTGSSMDGGGMSGGQMGGGSSKGGMGGSSRSRSKMG